jgi:hypothetical protein
MKTTKNQQNNKPTTNQQQTNNKPTTNQQQTNKITYEILTIEILPNSLLIKTLEQEIPMILQQQEGSHLYF